MDLMYVIDGQGLPSTPSNHPIQPHPPSIPRPQASRAIQAPMRSRSISIVYNMLDSENFLLNIPLFLSTLKHHVFKLNEELDQLYCCYYHYGKVFYIYNDAFPCGINLSWDKSDDSIKTSIVSGYEITKEEYIRIVLILMAKEQLGLHEDVSRFLTEEVINNALTYDR